MSSSAVIIGDKVVVNINIITGSEENVPIDKLPTGVIVLKNGSKTIDVKPLTNGNAVFEFSSLELGIGKHGLTAYYAGDKNYAPQSSYLLIKEVVHPINTSTYLNCSSLLKDNNSIDYLEPIKFICNVISIELIESGTIQFYDNNIKYSSPIQITPTKSGCEAEIIIPKLSVGNHKIKAVYNGWYKFLKSDSNLFEINVNKVIPKGIISSDNNPSMYNENILLIASFSTPLDHIYGTVRFYDNNTPITENISLVNGTGSTKISSLTSGVHNISAKYNGDLNHNELSIKISQMINSSKTQTKIYSDFNASLTTLTIIVSSKNGAPNGFVDIFDNDTLLKTIQLNGLGVALFSNKFSEGHHSITATYTGSSNYGQSISNIINQNIVWFDIEAIYEDTDTAILGKESFVECGRLGNR